MNRSALITLGIIISVLGVGVTILNPLDLGDDNEVLQSLMDATGLTQAEAAVFHSQYQDYAPYNNTILQFANYTTSYSLTANQMLLTTQSFQHSIASLNSILSKQIPDNQSYDFITKHTEMITDDGINATDLMLLEFYVQLPGIIDQLASFGTTLRENAPDGSSHDVQV